MTEDRLDWAPEACALPTAEQPLRLAEFDDLFAATLREQTRESATRLRWIFDPGSEATVRDLTARESACCSFFTFTITTPDQALQVDVEVPPAQVEVLDALRARAAAGMMP